MDNGFNVVTDYIPEARATSIYWAVRVGGRHYPVAGAGHFLEHMLAESLCAKDGVSVAKRFGAISVSSNFTTSPDCMQGFATVLPMYASEIINTLGSINRLPLWNGEIFNDQKTLILNESRETKTSQFDVHRILKRSFDGHPVGRLTLGEKEDIEKMSEAVLLDYMNAHFLAGDMALVVSGPMTHEEVLFLANENFKSIKPGKNPAQIKPVGHYGQYQLNVRPKEEQAIIFSSPSISVKDKNYEARANLMPLLGTSLHDFLREEGYSYEGVWRCYDIGFSDFGQNVICFFTEPAKAASAARGVAAYISQPDLWLTEEKFDLMKLREETEKALNFFNPAIRAEGLTTYFANHGSIISVDEIIENESQINFQSVVSSYECLKATPLSVFGDGPCESLPSPQEINAIISGQSAPHGPVMEL